jgi:hypothetical protein
MLSYKKQDRTRQPYVKNTHKSEGRSLGSGADLFSYTEDTDVKAMANVRSLPDEPYMSSRRDNLQSLVFQLAAVTPIRGFAQIVVDSWAKLRNRVADDEDFGRQFKRTLNNEEAITSKAKAIKLNDDKIAFIFNSVRDAMKSDGYDAWYTNDGTVKAWEKKTGNPTEINLILLHLLKQSGVDAYPMLVSTRSHGKVNPAFPFLYQFNRSVVYIKVDSTKKYVLDASDKYNSYNEIPENLLNSFGFYIAHETDAYDLVFLDKAEPVRQVVMVNAEVKPGGKMEGTAQLYNYSYHRLNAIERFKTDGEKKYTDYLRNDDNNLKVSSIKFENMEVDTLPLIQHIDFALDLAGSDDNYIFITPNVFSPFTTNTFLSENRYSDIDFGRKNTYSIMSTYKIPAGYKSDALPKSASMVMPDKSISFRRIVAEQDGAILVRYTIDYKKTVFFKEDYPQIRDFYKKMFEMLNEKIVLKKS